MEKQFKILLITQGADGAELYTNKFKLKTNGLQVDVKDTTGAGDAFIGSFLASLISSDKEIKDLSLDDLTNLLEFSNRYAAFTTTKMGALCSMPAIQELQNY